MTDLKERSTVDQTWRERIAEALAEHDGEDAALAFRVGAAEEYWLGQADVALTVVDHLLVEKNQELETLHKAWMAQRDEIMALRAQQPQPSAEVTSWCDGDPEPAIYVQAVRGHLTKRLYQRESREHFGGRWINRATGQWFTWASLLRYEQSAHLFNLGV